MRSRHIMRAVLLPAITLALMAKDGSAQCSAATESLIAALWSAFDARDGEGVVEP